MAYFFCWFLLIPLALFSQSVPKDAPLSQKEWDSCEQFIKKEASKYFERGILLITPRKGLPYPIEKDPLTGYVFIHLKDHPKGYIGKGCHKVVTKSILYGPKAFVVARCEANYTGQHEAELLRRLGNARGIDRMYAFIPRADNRGDLFVEYANRGTLYKVAVGKITLSKTALLSTLSDMVAGLINLHKAGILHRDIKRTNIFLGEKNGVYHAMIGDMGLSTNLDENLDQTLSIPNSSCDPIMYLKPFRDINRIQADTYSLGTIIYALVFQEFPKWTHLLQKDLPLTLSRSEQAIRYQTIQTIYNKEYVHAPLRVAGIRKKIAKIALEMLHPEPEKRPTLIEVQSKLDRI